MRHGIAPISYIGSYTLFGISGKICGKTVPVQQMGTGISMLYQGDVIATVVETVMVGTGRRCTLHLINCRARVEVARPSWMRGLMPIRNPGPRAYAVTCMKRCDMDSSRSGRYISCMEQNVNIRRTGWPGKWVELAHL